MFDFAQIWNWYRLWSYDTPCTWNVQGQAVKGQGYSVTSDVSQERIGLTDFKLGASISVKRRMIGLASSDLELLSIAISHILSHFQFSLFCDYSIMSCDDLNLSALMGVGFYQRSRQTASRSIYTTCRPAWRVPCRRSHFVTTCCWHGRQPLHKHTEQSLSRLAQSLPDKTGDSYNLTARRHSFSLTVKTDCSNVMNRLLFEDIICSFNVMAAFCPVR